ncbi:hypothetical protein ACX1NX_08760 [Acinetobacter sp. ANC 5383]
MDLILKYLPLIIFIFPILSWLDSRKRFLHNAKFYSDRASSVKKYEEECSRVGIKDHEKSAFAQALAGTDKLGYRDIDILKFKFPDRFFVMIGKIKKIRNKITIEELDGKDVFVSRKTLKTLEFRPIWYFFMYFSSVPIISSNSLLILLFKKFGWNIILVDATTYSFIQWGALLLGVGVAISAAINFINNDVLLSLIKKEKMVMSKEEFQIVLNQQNESLET